MSQGLSPEAIAKWEGEHGFKLPVSLNSIYQTLNGGRWPGTDFEFLALERVVSCQDAYPDEDVSELLESDDPESDDFEECPLKPSDLCSLFRFGQALGSDDIFVDLDSEPQSMYIRTEFDLSPLHPSAELFFADLVQFDEASSVDWQASLKLDLFASETLESMDGVIENHLARDDEGNLILLSRISTGENEVLMTKATIRELKPAACSILAYPTGYYMHLEPRVGQGSEVRSASSVQGWKNESEDAVTAGFMSSDQEKLRQLRSQLIGEEASAKLVRQEESQDALVSEFSDMDPAEQEAAGAAIASSILRDALQSFEYDEEDDPDGLAASLMGGFEDSMEKLALGMEAKAGAAGVTTETSEKLAEIVKGLVDDED